MGDEADATASTAPGSRRASHTNSTKGSTTSRSGSRAPSAASTDFKFGGSTDIGHKPENQDDYDMVKLSDLREHFFAVYDGHGKNGRAVVDFIKANFLRYFREHPDIECHMKEAVVQAYMKMQTELLSSGLDVFMSGSTATTIFANKQRIMSFHVGDSTAVVVEVDSGSNVSTKQLTIEHNCEVKEEADRLRKAGARIEPMRHEGQYMGPPRLWKGTLPYPGQCVSRSLGDDVAHTVGVLSEPSVVEFKLEERHKYLVVATDGIWDGLSHDKVGSIVHDGFTSGKTSKQVSAELVQRALIGLEIEEIDDNVTALVIDLRSRLEK